jgi:hypothetical protein
MESIELNRFAPKAYNEFTSIPDQKTNEGNWIFAIVFIGITVATAYGIYKHSKSFNPPKS